jgi:hypothetical protein
MRPYEGYQLTVGLSKDRPTQCVLIRAGLLADSSRLFCGVCFRRFSNGLERNRRCQVAFFPRNATLRDVRDSTEIGESP